MTAATPTVLIIGIGNPLRRDDGFGPAVVDALEAAGLPGSVKLMAVHQLAPEIVEDLIGVERVVFVDARVPESASHSDILFEPIEALDPTRDTLTHDFPPNAILHLAAAIGQTQPEAWTLSAPAADLSHGEGLSPPCQVHAERAVSLLREWLDGSPSAP